MGKNIFKKLSLLLIIYMGALCITSCSLVPVEDTGDMEEEVVKEELEETEEAEEVEELEEMEDEKTEVDSEEVEDEEESKDRTEEVVKNKGMINVNWYDTPVAFDKSIILEPLKEGEDPYNNYAYWMNEEYGANVHEYGEVVGGTYDGYKYMVFEYPMEMGPQVLHKFLYNIENDERVLLTDVSYNSGGSGSREVYTKESNLQISGASTPDSVTHNGIIYTQKDSAYSMFADVESAYTLTKMFEAEGFEFYLSDNNGCMYAKLADGTTVKYMPNYDFIIPTEGYYLSQLSKLDVTLNDGTDLSEEAYSYTALGCGGFFGCLNVVADNEYKSVYEHVESWEGGPSIESSIEVVGKTSTGEDIYAFKDMNHPVLKRSMESMESFVGTTVNLDSDIDYTEMYDLDVVPKQYLKLFYKNNFGQLIGFTNERLIPPVECGKPVVYLYPEKEMDISVEVFPRGGVTISEPDYNDGWNVTAYPDGSVVNHADGKTYTSLFWESESYGDYIAEQGFVISDAHKAKELNDILVRYGFNDLEREEFLEYWTVKLQGSDYYFAGLLPQYELDKVAPLEITPAPDKVYRLFFNFFPVEKNFPHMEPVVIPMERDGYVVTEWGGSY